MPLPVRRMFDTFGLQLRAKWQDLLSGYWFVPGTVTVCCLLLAVICLTIDHVFGPTRFALVYAFNPGAARNLLAALTGSFITITGLVFSITTVTLQLLSSQYTPRVLREFTNDRTTQIVAGGFVGIFAYCLLVLTTVQSPSASEQATIFVPGLSITVAVGMGFLGLVLLLVFIHHMIQVIQVPNIAAKIAHETVRSIEHLYPREEGDSLDEDGEELVASWYKQSSPVLVYPERDGYIQAISLRNIAGSVPHPESHLYVMVCSGDFVTRDTPVVAVWSPEELDDDCYASVQQSVIVGSERDITQDVDFGIRQLTDITLAAISPAVNAPTTAVTCIGYIQGILEQLASKDFPSAALRVEGTQVVARYRSFREYADAFIEIGRYATKDARVAGTVLEALVHIAEVCSHLPQRKAILADIALAVAEPAIEDARTDPDRDLLKEQLRRVQEVVNRTADSEQNARRRYGPID